MSHNHDKNQLEQAFAAKRALDAYFTSKIQEAAGASEIRRTPFTGPDWPVRSDYPNRAAFRAACVEWRKNH